MRRAIVEGKINTKLTCIDPEPRVEIQQYADEQLIQPVEELEPSTLAGILDANDILFIYPSHTVTTGGDLPFLYLEILPPLPPGVPIPAHHPLFPFYYPKQSLQL